ncbi:MAG: pteridine reductase [Xanthomonadales bacterium]|nr:pteridine reductase [Xanthomonadales bacterium]
MKILQKNKQALVTGGAQRLGAVIARHLHAAGYDLILHYRNSADAAHALAAELQLLRPESVKLVNGDLADQHSVSKLIEQVSVVASKLTVVVNNASAFYPTAVGEVEYSDWNQLMDANLRGAFFLTQALAGKLKTGNGCIINIADIYAGSPLAGHAVYNIAKAGVVMMTRTFARELAPQVRVNAISPGIILWPENEPAEALKQQLLKGSAAGRQGCPGDVAAAVVFLADRAAYITGHTLNVDGGRALYI